MRRLSFVLMTAIVSAQSPTGTVEISDARRASAAKLREQAEAITNRFEAHIFRGTDGHTMPYRLLRPAKPNAGRTYPLVVLLHGSGGSGTDNTKQFTGGNLVGSRVWALDANQARQPVFVIAPQTDQGWDEQFNPKAAAQSADRTAPGAKLLFELLDSVVSKLPVDRKRIYVTGQSMGGYGAFYVAMKRPDLFAAAVPVCGGGIPEQAHSLRGVPFWVFHGNADQTVSVQHSREMVNAIRAAGGTVAFTEYDGVGHNSWELAYSEPELLRWLYAQHK